MSMMANVNRVALGAFISVGLIAFHPTQAKADIISTFQLSGNFASTSLPYITLPLSGSITVDVTSGIIQSQALLVYPPYANYPFFSFIQGYDDSAKSYSIYAVSSGGMNQELIYFDAATLLDYAGGNLGSTAHPTVGGSVSKYNEAEALPPDVVLKDDTATLETVPEPNSAGLLMVGMSMLTLIGFRRMVKRRQ